MTRRGPRGLRLAAGLAIACLLAGCAGGFGPGGGPGRLHVAPVVTGPAPRTIPLRLLEPKDPRYDWRLTQATTPEPGRTAGDDAVTARVETSFRDTGYVLDSVLQVAEEPIGGETREGWRYRLALAVLAPDGSEVLLVERATGEAWWEGSPRRLADAESRRRHAAALPRRAFLAGLDDLLRRLDERRGEILSLTRRHHPRFASAPASP